MQFSSYSHYFWLMGITFLSIKGAYSSRDGLDGFMSYFIALLLCLVDDLYA